MKSNWQQVSDMTWTMRSIQDENTLPDNSLSAHDPRSPTPSAGLPTLYSDIKTKSAVTVLSQSSRLGEGFDPLLSGE